MENIEDENFKEVAAATISEEVSETIVKKENVKIEETLKAEEDSLNRVKTEESVNIVKNEDTEIVDDDKMCNTKREEFNISETKVVHEDDRKIFVRALPPTRGECYLHQGLLWLFWRGRKRKFEDGPSDRKIQGICFCRVQRFGWT